MADNIVIEELNGLGDFETGYSLGESIAVLDGLGEVAATDSGLSVASAGGSAAAAARAAGGVSAFSQLGSQVRIFRQVAGATGGVGASTAAAIAGARGQALTQYAAAGQNASAGGNLTAAGAVLRSTQAATGQGAGNANSVVGETPDNVMAAFKARPLGFTGRENGIIESAQNLRGQVAQRTPPLNAASVAASPSAQVTLARNAFAEQQTLAKAQAAQRAAAAKLAALRNQTAQVRNPAALAKFRADAISAGQAHVQATAQIARSNAVIGSLNSAKAAVAAGDTRTATRHILTAQLASRAKVGVNTNVLSASAKKTALSLASGAPLANAKVRESTVHVNADRSLTDNEIADRIITQTAPGGTGTLTLLKGQVITNFGSFNSGTLLRYVQGYLSEGSGAYATHASAVSEILYNRLSGALVQNPVSNPQVPMMIDEDSYAADAAHMLLDQNYARPVEVRPAQLPNYGNALAVQGTTQRDGTTDDAGGDNLADRRRVSAFSGLGHLGDFETGYSLGGGLGDFLSDATSAINSVTSAVNNAAPQVANTVAQVTQAARQIAATATPPNVAPAQLQANAQHIATAVTQPIIVPVDSSNVDLPPRPPIGWLLGGLAAVGIGVYALSRSPKRMAAAA